MKLLKQTWSGEIYVWTENLAKRDDMVPYEREVVAPPEEQQPEKPKTRKVSLKTALAKKAEELN